MNIKFMEYDGSTVAINPRIEHRGEQLTMKLNEQNCDYFLVFSRISGGKVDLSDSQLQDALMSVGEQIVGAKDLHLTGEIVFSCVEWSDYRVNDYAIELSNRIAEYTVTGCRADGDIFRIYVPSDDVSCTVSVSLTVTYRISQISGETVKRPFGKDLPQQSFFVVEFEDISNYQDGEIVYTFEGQEQEFPITKSMLENGRFFIEAGMGCPYFSTTVSGLELQQA